MRFLTVRELKSAPGRIWSSNEDEEIVVTSNGRPVALLTRIDEQSFEQELELRRRTRALLTLDRIHRDSRHHGTDKMSDDDVDAEIRAVRAKRSRRS